MRSERVIGGALVVLSVCLILVAQAIPRHAFARGPSASFWPTTVLFLLAICGVWLFWSSNKTVTGNTEAGKCTAKDNQAHSLTEAAARRTAVSIILLLAYVIGLQILGFVLATVAFQIAYLYSLEIRRPVTLIVLPVSTTAALLTLFTKVSYAALPRGIWLFRELSSLLY
jgi:beta-lactamase regulating signal transducer with metallopeptidase domain